MIARGSVRTMLAGRRYQLKVALAFTAIYLVYGSTYLAIRYSVETIPPLMSAGIRLSVAGAVLFAWAWVRGFRPTRGQWIAGAVVGALFFLVSHGMLYWAERTVDSGFAALLIATEPIFILVLAWLSGQARISARAAVGLGLGVLGVGLLAGEELVSKSSSLPGITAVLLGALSWSAGVVLSPRLPLPDDAVARAAIPLVCGAVMLLAAAGVAGEFRSEQWASISLRSVVGLVYLIVFGSVVTFTAYTWLLQRCSATMVATHTYVNPVVALLLGWLFASESISARLVLASVVILLAIVLIRRAEVVPSDGRGWKTPSVRSATGKHFL